jgi:hypothetical protein
VQQTALSFDDSTPWERLRLVLDNACHYLGMKEVVFRLNAAKSTVSDSLGDKNDRHWRQEWTLDVLEMLRERYTETANQFMKAILDAQAEVSRRYEVIRPDEEPTDEEIEAAQRTLAKARRKKKSA